MKKLLLIALLSTSCAMPQRSSESKPKSSEIASRSDRITSCLDRYLGEGFKAAYEICKDLYTLE